MARVLVVDDEGGVREVLEDTLRDAGHKVTTVENAERARAQFQQGDYDIAIIDYVMPGEDGLSLAEFLRSEHIPVVMITGSIEIHELRRRDLPVLGKPFSSAELEQAIQVALNAPAKPVSRDHP